VTKPNDFIRWTTPSNNLPVRYEPPVKLVLVEQPEPDEHEERQEFLAAVRAAKDDDTELITDLPDDTR
jgi:hypothetical protein